MPDWTKTMEQSFEYYEVDPGTWRDKTLLKNVKTATIDRDSDAETLGSATIELTELVGEAYVRIYLVTIQNGITEKFPLATVLMQTPSTTFDGKLNEISVDAYTPLIELKEKQPSIGYSLPKGTNILDAANILLFENLRAPVVETTNTKTLDADFVSNTDDTWVTYIRDLINKAKYDLDLDEMGRVLYAPVQDVSTLQPVWTYNDDNISILYPDITFEHDLYDVPNVVEVIYSDGNETMYSKAVNDDPNSPTSIPSRGREIHRRITNPTMLGVPMQYELDEYAEEMLRQLSTLEYTISYSHGYCPVRVGQCVRINYSKAGLFGIKAKVIQQTIKCETGCPVSEKAIFTVKLWG